jgi:hypothetical protein
MANNQDATFGQKLAKGQQILDYIKTLVNYKSPNLNLNPDKFADLLNQVNEANSIVANTKNLLAQARQKRSDLYYGEDGIKKRCAMIRDFIAILPAGKSSPAYITVQKECQKMNNYKKPTKKEEITADSPENNKKTVSSAETSFGSLLQATKNVLEVIKNIPEFSPANPIINKTGFTQFIADIEAANQAVNTQQYAYNQAVSKRSELYEGANGLHACFQGIKTFIAASYGKSSVEFKEVSKLKY